TGKLVGACLTDRMADGFSAVYSFFETGCERRSFGTFMILWLIERARSLGLPHVYLGFWVAECDKMAYKSRFRPLEAYTPDGWRLLDTDDPESTRQFRSRP
ncbi:MAG: arginyltransferase, partial [Bacteroidota bacterium]